MKGCGRDIDEVKRGRNLALVALCQEEEGREAEQGRSVGDVMVRLDFVMDEPR